MFVQGPYFVVGIPPSSTSTQRVKLGLEWVRIDIFGLDIIHIKIPIPTILRNSSLVVVGGGWF